MEGLKGPLEAFGKCFAIFPERAFLIKCLPVVYDLSRPRPWQSEFLPQVEIQEVNDDDREKKLFRRIWAEPVWEGLNRVWGVIRGLQRRDNQQGFILTFEVVVVVVVVVGMGIFPFQRQCDDPPLTIWIGQQSCCPAQGRRLLDPTCALAQPWPCWLLNFLSQRVTHLEHISPLLLKQDPDCPYCLTQLRAQYVLFIILCIHFVF